MAPLIDKIIAGLGRTSATADLMRRCAAREQVEAVRVALDSGCIIGAALGILMERYRITIDDAFDVVISISEETGRDLSRVAKELVETGYCPTDE